MASGTRSAAAGLALLLAGCAAAPAASAGPVLPADAAASEAAISAVIEAALEADARRDTADTLYAALAEVVREGTLVGGWPRFAGVDAGGRTAVTSSRVEVGPTLAWGTVEYRWVAADQREAREGIATFLLTRLPGGGPWRIVHAHSSTPR